MGETKSPFARSNMQIPRDTLQSVTSPRRAETVTKTATMGRVRVELTVEIAEDL